MFSHFSRQTLNGGFTASHFVSTDVKFFLVLAVSLVLCFACLCFLVRAYRRKNQYRGKQREIQRPFIKGKRGLQSPRSPVLFGNLVSLDNIIMNFTDAISLSSLNYPSVEFIFVLTHGAKNEK